MDTPRFGRHARYTGPIRLDEKELAVRYGNGRTIFVENTGDLFAESTPAEWIFRILGHCREWPDNTYVFQTKNPERILVYARHMPPSCIVGTTLESDREHFGVSLAPPPSLRSAAMVRLPRAVRRFVTVEPILACDPEALAYLVHRCRPEFVNVGADSKGKGLQEPDPDTVERFLRALEKRGITTRTKSNLARLLKGKK
jgi:protein gp37